MTEVLEYGHRERLHIQREIPYDESYNGNNAEVHQRNTHYGTCKIPLREDDGLSADKRKSADTHRSEAVRGEFLNGNTFAFEGLIPVFFQKSYAVLDQRLQFCGLGAQRNTLLELKVSKKRALHTGVRTLRYILSCKQSEFNSKCLKLHFFNRG